MSNPKNGSAEFQRQRSAERKAAGLCVRCVNPAVPGHVTCQKCATKRTNMYKQRKKNGQCYMCSAKAEEGKTYCRKHLDQAKQLFIRRKLAKICPRCGNTPQNGKIHCQACLDRESPRNKAKYIRCKKLGLCSSCGKPSGRIGLALCEKCRQKRIAKNLALKIETLNVYGGCQCVCCKTECVEFLTLEHPDNDGCHHRRALKVEAGKSFYGKLKSLGFPKSPRLVVMCFNCNISRGIYGYCPCQNKRADHMVGSQ